MNKNYAKWAVAVAFIIVVVYILVSRYDSDKLYKTISFKTTEELEDKLSRLSKDVVWSKIKRRPKPKEIYEKCIVVTSVSRPTVQVKKLSKITGWKLIVVADTKTPANWK